MRLAALLLSAVIAAAVPATAAHAEPLAPLSIEVTYECDRIIVTVINNTASPIDYSIATIQDPEPNPPHPHTIYGGDSWSHEFPHQGLIVKSVALQEDLVINPRHCEDLRPGYEVSMDCHGNALFGVTNSTAGRMTQIAVLKNGVVDQQFELEPFTRKSMLFSGLGSGGRIALRWFSEKLGENVIVSSIAYLSDQACVRIPHGVKVSTTCQGLRITAGNVTRPSTLWVVSPGTNSGHYAQESKYAFNENEAKQIEVVIQHEGAVVVAWQRPWDPALTLRSAAAILIYDRAAACAGGSMPVTGAKTWQTVAVGLFLVTAGVAALLVARRRRMPA